MKLPQIDQTAEFQTFTVTSGGLRVTDPCYDMDTWCAGQLENVMDGIWQAHVGYHKDSLDMEMNARWRAQRVEEIEKAKAVSPAIADYYADELRRYDERTAAYIGRVAYLHIVNIGAQQHFDHLAELDSTWEDSGIHVGVDSGQAGFFDLDTYRALCADQAVKEKFYDEVCDLTLADSSWGVHPSGAVSSSGYGDGGYECLVRRVDGLVVEAIIIYISEYEEEDEEDEAVAT
jgi:hypothetical protein